MSSANIPENQVPFCPNTPQYHAMCSKARETFLMGGVGLGKSYFLAIQLFQALSNTGAVCGLFAPTQKVLKNSTFRQVQRAWDSLGFYAETHYVINTKPPAEWNVQPFAFNNKGILTTAFGSYCILDGLENYNTQRGVEFDEIFIDEFRDINLQECRTVLTGRLRGDLYKKLGRKHRIWYASTPPENVSYLKELRNNKTLDIQFITGKSTDNKSNLPDGYIESLYDSYDEITAKRELEGELIGYSSNLFFQSFDRTKHVKETKINAYSPFYLSFDFNVDPMTCVVCQHVGADISVLKEFYIRNTEVPTGVEPISWTCKLISKWLPEHANVYITGDRSGNNSHAMAQKGVNFYSIIQSEFPGARIMAKGANPHLLNSRIQCNSAFAKMEIKIHPDCKKFINDLENVQIIPGIGELRIDKSNPNLTHISDCFRYYLYTFHSEHFHRVNRLEPK